jgi:hypothetical protein
MKQNLSAAGGFVCLFVWRRQRLSALGGKFNQKYQIMRNEPNFRNAKNGRNLSKNNELQ